MPVGTNVSLGSQVMHSAFAVSIVLSLIAAGFSAVGGKEDRKASEATSEVNLTE
jgi:hypothetical protein